MIWKILFFIGSGLFVLLNIIGHSNLANDLSEVTFILNIVFAVVYIIILGYFYALGWNEKVYPNNINKIVIAIFSLSAIFFLYLIGKSFYTTSMLTIIFVVLVVAVIFSPIYIAMMKYTKKNNFKNANNIFIKIFMLFCVVGLSSTIVSLFIFKTSNLINFSNIWDKWDLVTSIYQSILVVCFAFKKKFFSQLFWKISGIIYLLSWLPTMHFMSASRYDNLLSYQIFGVLFMGITVYVLWKYAFTNYVFGQGDGELHPEK